MKKRVRMFPDEPLGKPVKRFEDTFSAETVMMETFFPEAKAEQIQAIDDVVAPEFASGGWVTVEDENTAAPAVPIME
ncbi:hypothetical protein [Tardiphaga sp. 841_E9_N1_2]|uniref:hypothetical protein n=1 Tax=Tardiphaga sp. 841_E9_N1_2 TaxID=3240762 RepID=UPI003F200273